MNIFRQVLFQIFPDPLQPDVLGGALFRAGKTGCNQLPAEQISRIAIRFLNTVRSDERFQTRQCGLKAGGSHKRANRKGVRQECIRIQKSRLAAAGVDQIQLFPAPAFAGTVQHRFPGPLEQNGRSSHRIEFSTQKVRAAPAQNK